MEKYLQYDPASLDEMLAACRDYKERQNIRSALRELKGIKLEDNSFVTLSFSSKNIRPHSSASSVTSSSDIRSRSDNEVTSSKVETKHAPDKFNSNSNVLNGINDSKAKDSQERDENSNEQPKFRTYLYAGRIGSPNVSPRKCKKEQQSPRKVHHTPFTRIKVLDKSDLVDKCTETEEGDVSLKSNESEKVKETGSHRRSNRIIRARTVEKAHRFQSTPKPGVEPHLSDKDVLDLNTSAIEFSSDLGKLQGTSVLHRPVSVNIFEFDCDKTKDIHQSPTTQASDVISSPRKPRKIVSYRTSAFTPASKLGPVSSTVSRARLASAPTFSDSSGNSQVKSFSENKSESFSHSSADRVEVPYTTNNCDKDDQLDYVPESGGKANDSSVESNSIGTKLRTANEQLKKLFHSDITYRASPCAIRVGNGEEDTSLVTRLRNKLESKRKKDIKSDLEEFSYFTNKMKEKHGKKSVSSNANEDIVLSPVSTDPTIRLGENEINEGNSLISNYTSNKSSVTMEDKNEANLLKKKSALSRRNRVDSDEGNIYRKYRKKPKDEKSVSDLKVLKADSESVFEERNLIETPKKVYKSLSVRRKLPEVPAKHDSDQEDDETVHQRTIRLLQERRNERREKTAVEKDVSDKGDKSKMSPAVLKKNLEQKLERSDSKRKAYRVRRELQLLNRENELNGDQSGSDDEVKSINDKLDKHYMDTYTHKSDMRASSRSDRRFVQRSKSDTAHRRRAVSETDSVIRHSNNVVDGESENGNVLEMFEVDEKLNPVQKINLIGSLMQEEAKIQELLRMSSNFSEKRRMRVEVRQLRQKRMALEGVSDKPPPTRLQRSASVTAVTVARAHLVDIRRPESVCERRSEHYVRQTSIEELRKQLSETQDYDEKKKIRLALRQLRQQTRDGSQPGLQRSQSFVHRKSSEQAVNGTSQSNTSLVIRSQSVNEQRIPDKDSGQDIERKSEKQDKSSLHGRVKVTSKEDRHSNNENGVATSAELENLRTTRQSFASNKPPIPKSVHKHSSFNSNTSDSSHLQDTSQGRYLPSTNSIDSVIQKFSNNTSNSSVQNFKGRLESDEEAGQKVRDHVKERDSEKTSNSYSSRRHSSFDVRNSNTNGHISDEIDTHKPVELLKDTVIRLENQKLKRDYGQELKDYEKNATETNNVRKSRSDVKSHDKGSGIANVRTSHILVSKADVEKDKQSRLVNLRRNRSQSEPRRESGYHGRRVVDEKEIYSKKLDSGKEIEKQGVESKSEISLDTSSKNLTRGHDKEIKDISSKSTVQEKSDTVEEEKRLSPPLLWLEEKKKSLNSNSESDKLLSTLDIEAAFSEILGAVEDLPEQKVAMDIVTDIPILEEESAEMEENAVENEISEKNANVEAATDDVVEGSTKDTDEINNDTQSVKNEYDNDKCEDSAMSPVIENMKSEATIQLRSDLSLDINSTPETNSAISVIHGDDGTVTVKEVSRVEEGDTTITEWKKIRRTQSRTETRETDTVVEKKITSPGGNSSVYEKDVSKTKHKLTSRGSNYFTRNQLNIKRRTNLDGSELVEQDLSSVSENVSVSKNESWGDKSEARVVLHKDVTENSQTVLKPIENGSGESNVNLQDKRLSLPGDEGVSVIQSHLGKPSGCPEITSTLKEITVSEGCGAKFVCTVVSSPAPSVTWYKGDNPMSEEDSVVIDFDTDTGIATLRIEHVALTDTAVYKCVFQNPLGEATTSGTLKVNKKSSGYPMFLTDLSDKTVCEGSSLCLECQVSDANVVTWYKDGVVQRNNADFKQTFDGSKARLEIVEVFLDDRGTYACALKNANGEKRSFCRVTVKEAESADAVFPMFLKKPETMIADELDPVIIESEVIGSPQPEITWLLDDMKLNEDSRHRMSFDGRVAMLVVRRVTTQDSGRIQCIAENSSGKVSAECMLVVRASTSPPKVCQQLSDQTSISGKNISLKCLISGEPVPEITWRKNGLVISQMFNFKQTYVDGLAILEISKCCTQDSGCYECLATNEKGEISTSCCLTVNEEPVIVEKPESKSEPVTVDVDEPVTVRKHDDEVVKGNNNIVVSLKVNEKVIEEAILNNHVDESENGVEVNTVIKVNNDNDIKKVNTEVYKESLYVDKDKIEPTENNTAHNREQVQADSIITEEPTIKPKISVDEEKVETAAVKSFSSNFSPKSDEDQKQTAKSQASKIMSVRHITEEPTIKSKISVDEEKVETAAVKCFSSNFSPKSDEDQKQTAKSQASKIMSVRQGSFKSVQASRDKPVAISDSNHSIKTTAQSVDNNLNKKVVVDNGKCDETKELNVDDNIVVKDNDNTKTEERSVDKIEKKEMDLNRNYSNKVNANIAPSGDVTASKGDLNKDKKPLLNETKSIEESSKLNSLCLEDQNQRTAKPVAKFRTGGEVRRSQSVRAPGNEKPEWLQVKLRRVGNNPTPSSFLREIEKQQAESPKPASSNSKKEAQDEKPACVQRVSTLNRSQSVKTVGRNHPSALIDTTNSPANPSKRDSVKLTPVAERAKIFQMKSSSSDRDSSGKSSPIDIISKAINLSRAESMRTPAGHRSGAVQRSQSFKTDTPSTASQRDITLELTPQKSQEPEERSDSSKGQKSIKYWDPFAPSTTTMDYESITDEEQLSQMLSNSDNFDERKKIRSRIKELRDQHMKEWEAKQKARERDTEDLIKKKHREADALKQQKLEQFKKQAAEQTESKHLDMAEQHLREKVRLADAQKKKTLDDYNQRAAVHQESTHLEVSERVLQDRIKQADLLKQKTLEAYDKAAGKTDGKTVTTTRKVETTTKVAGPAGKPADEIAPKLAQQFINAAGNVSGVLTVKTESWSSKDNIRHTSEKTESWGGRGRGAMNAFKQMDAKNNPPGKTNAPGAGRANITRSPSAIKTMLLEWCKAMTREYVDTIEITNFSTCWNDGIAFCALIHHFYPEAFDFKSLNPKQRRKNFELAFDTAEKYADIAPLLDVEDMVRMQKPDWKCVFTYVQSFYRKLSNHEKNKAAAPPTEG